MWLSTTILGFGTVFVGLIALILIVTLTSLVINSLNRKKEEPVKAVPAADENEIANRQEFVAAVSAAIATVMGKDVSGLRIRSIKKIS
ncbi:MAG: OadG family protein [Clostridia bacterium]|nr:OadG family protein [Clostridia bacterium]